jgi:excisionase family DNA binding protein
MKLSDLLSDPAVIERLSRESIAALRGELAHLDTLLLGRLFTPKDPEPEDQLLTVSEAAARLGVSTDYLYHHPELPFTRRMGRKLLFSARGIEKHISQKIR